MEWFENVKTILMKIWAVLTTVFMALTGIIQGNDPVDIPGATLVDTKQYVLDDSYVTAQGLAYDGEYYYTSGALSAVYMAGLAKLSPSTGEIIIKDVTALPSEFTQLGYDHIGGIGVSGGYIYAAVEDRAEDRPLVLLFDTQTLEYTGKWYDCTSEYLTDGIPWCTVDADNGFVYTSRFRDATEIVAFNLSDLSFSHIIPLSEPITRVQAGSYFEGKIYVNLDDDGGDLTKTVKTVDVATGEVKTLFVRNVGGYDCETEGITVYRNADGELTVVVSDYDKTVATFMRTYIVK